MRVFAHSHSCLRTLLLVLCITQHTTHICLPLQLLSTRDLGLSHMRMLPKLNGMRPIVNLSKATRIRLRVPEADGQEAVRVIAIIAFFSLHCLH